MGEVVPSPNRLCAEARGDRFPPCSASGSPVRSRRPHQLRQSNPTPRAHRRRQDDLHHEDAIAGAHGPWATERGKCPINKTSEDSVPRRAQIQAPQGTKSSLDIRILFSPSHRAKPLRQHTVQPSYRRPGWEGPSFLLSDSACSRSERGNLGPSRLGRPGQLHRVLRQVLQGDDVHAHVVGAAVTLLVLAHCLDGAHIRVGGRHRRHAGHAAAHGLGA